MAMSDIYSREVELTQSRRMKTIVAPLLALLLIAFSASLTPGHAQENTVSRTQIVLLGTGTPNPNPERMGPAVAIIVDQSAYLVDFGTGVVRQAQAARDKGVEALAPENLRTAFLTHIHSDHTLGLADLVLTPWIMDRDVPLRLYGPPGTRKLADNLLRAYGDDIEIRVNGSQPISREGWKVLTQETTGGWVYSDPLISVEAFPVCHGEVPNSLGYRFKTPDKVIVISGDTTYCPIIAEMAQGADILLHEVYSDAGFNKLPKDWQAYHANHHTSASDVARIAKAAQPGLLILTHQLSWGSEPHEEILDEVKAGYDGNVAYGRDLDVF